jgi:hypothetical protein
MGIEPMVRVLQFCTVDSASVNRFQRIVRLLSECSYDVATCKNLEKFSKNGLPSGTGRPFPKMQAESRRLRNQR